MNIETEIFAAYMNVRQIIWHHNTVHTLERFVHFGRVISRLRWDLLFADLTWIGLKNGSGEVYNSYHFHPESTKRPEHQ